MTKEVLEKKTVKNRPVRRRLAHKGPLYAPQRPGYKRRWVNVTKNNVEDMLRLGYDIVVKDKENGIGLDDYEGAHSMGSAITRVVDDERGKKAILMETTIELFEQGRAEKRAEVDAVVERMHPKIGLGNLSLSQKDIK